MVARLAVIAGILIGAAGCPNQAAVPECTDSHYLSAVAADAPSGDLIYIVDSAPNVAGYPYAVERADTLAPILNSSNDGSDLALLTPATGGVIVVNGGAAARRFDSSGTLLWTAGYGALVGVSAGLTSGDRLVVADRDGVRLFEPDGTAAWGFAFPDAVEEVFQVVGDRQDGAWVLGIFSGDLTPWVIVPTQPARPPSGPFILHVNGSGAIVGANAWDGSSDERDNQLLMSVDASGAPVLVFRNRLKAGAPVLGGFDGAGQPLWSQPLGSGALVAADSDGNLLMLSGTYGILEVDRPDAASGQIASATFAIDMDDSGTFQMSVAAIPGGLLLAGERFPVSGETCPRTHFLLQVSTAQLSVSRLSLGLR